jgi:hypothetical protein
MHVEARMFLQPRPHGGMLVCGNHTRHEERAITNYGDLNEIS